VLGQPGHAELRADGGPAVVGFRGPAQDELAHGQGRLGGRDRVEVLRRGGPLIGAGVAVRAGLGEPVQIVRPALAVTGGLLVGEPVMDQPHDGPVRRRLQRDGHRRRARRQIRSALPAPGEDDPPARLHFGDGAAGGVAGDDGPPVVAPGPQVNPRGDRLPAAQPVGLSDQGKCLIGAQRHEHGLLERH
jgi:hypothetical protein